MDAVNDQRGGEDEVRVGVEEASQRLSGGEERIEIAERVGHLRGEVAFEVADDPRNSAGEKAEATANTADEKWVETIKP